MTVYSHTRRPIVGDECSESYSKALQKVAKRNRRTGVKTTVWIYKCTSFTRKGRSKELKHCAEIQQRIEHNDAGYVGVREEGRVYSNRRTRDSQRDEIRRLGQNYRRVERSLDRESDQEDRDWKRSQRRHREAMSSKPHTRYLAEPVSPDPSDGESSDSGTAEDSEPEDQPRRRSSEHARKRQSSLSPIRNREPEVPSQFEVDQAIELLRRLGMRVEVPNGGQSVIEVTLN